MLDPLVGEKTVSVRLSPAIYRRLEALAKRQKRSMSAQAALAIEEWLAKQPAAKPPPGPDK
jgi:predicted transcriptional regulator